jgi:hypothetical protein
MICLKKRFIFVHIPKTAGSSLSHALGLDWQNHKDIARYKKELSPSIFDDFFKFTVVRNPWARLVSEYSFQSRLSGHRASKLHAYDGNGRLRDFSSWVQAVFENPYRYPARVWGGSVSLGIHRWSPQTDWIEVDGTSAIDYVAKLENLDADCSHIARKLCIQLPTLPRQKRTFHAHYSSYYTSATRELVSLKYASDIEAFDYRFEESSAGAYTCKLNFRIRSFLSNLIHRE